MYSSTIIVLQPALADSDAKVPDRLKSARSKYEQSVADALDQYKKSIAAAKQDYLKAVKVAQDRATKAGELDEAIRIRSLKDSVQKELQELLHTQHPTIDSLPVSRWRVTYTEGSWRVYSIGKKNVITALDSAGAKLKGQVFSRKNGAFHVKFSTGGNRGLDLRCPEYVR